MQMVQAHRGASAYAPENTLPAFQLAKEMHSDGIECDIHLTSDGVLVVCHDDDIARTSNGSGSIAAMTLSELKRYDFGCHFSPGFSGTRIPTLDELLELVHDMAIINIECKGPLPTGRHMDEALEKLYDALVRFDCVERAIMSTFLWDWAKRSKELHPNLRTALLYGNRLSPDETLNAAHRHMADAMHPHLEHLDKEAVDACMSKGIDVNAWTIDSPEQIERAIAMEITGLITDVPDRALAALGRS